MAITPYILILFAWAWGPHPVAISQHEYSTQKTCIQAGQAAETFNTVKFVCVSK